jgi:hypothetical protein
MSILGFEEFATTLRSHVSTKPMSTSSRPVFGTPRLQGEGGFSLADLRMKSKEILKGFYEGLIVLAL